MEATEGSSVQFLKRKKEENKYVDSRQRYKLGHSIFFGQDIIECMIKFRIDRR